MAGLGGGTERVAIIEFILVVVEVGFGIDLDLHRKGLVKNILRQKK